MSYKLKCALCRGIIESDHPFKEVKCKCGNLAVTGKGSSLRTGNYLLDVLTLNDDGYWEDGVEENQRKGMCCYECGKPHDQDAYDKYIERKKLEKQSEV